MNPLDSYEQNQKFIHSIFSSRLKIQILLTLLSEHPPLSRLREITGSTSQALIPKIRSLESQMLIESRNSGYFLTPLGKAVAMEVSDFVNLMSGIIHHKEFWAIHDLSGIPDEFLQRIGELQDSEVKLDTQVDIMHVYSHFLKIVREAAYIHGISSIMSPGLAETVAERVVAGVPVELVVNTQVISLLAKEPYIGQIKQLLKFQNFKVWVTSEELKVGITVTDKYLSVGLFKNDSNLYDSSTDLFSQVPDAIRWGEDLFSYYRDRSVRIDLGAGFPLEGSGT
jgi:predicted transcriptional regulator